MTSRMIQGHSESTLHLLLTVANLFKSLRILKGDLNDSEPKEC